MSLGLTSFILVGVSAIECTGVAMIPEVPKSRIIYRSAKTEEKRKARKKKKKSVEGLAVVTDERAKRIRSRRERVLKMKLQGRTIDGMAKEEGVNFKTIRSDLDVIHEEMEKRMTAINPVRHVAGTVLQFDKVTEAAWEALEDAEGILSKDRLFNTIIKAQANKIDLLMKVGAVPRTAVRVDADLNIAQVMETVPEAARAALISPISRQKIIAAVKGLLQAGVADSLKKVEVEILDGTPSEK